MTPEAKNSERLVREHLDGELPECDRGALLHRLRNDPGALDLLTTHALMDARLRALGRGSAVAAARVPVEGLRGRKRGIVWKAAALVAGAALIVGIISRATRGPEMAAYEVSPYTNYVLEGRPGTPGHLSVGGSIALSQGAANLLLPSGVRCIASAPARITLTGRNAIDIVGGLAHFEVPKSGKDFRVRTPDFVVIDHGTAFTIDASESGRNEAHVVSGKIEVRTSGDFPKVSTLTDGQAVRVESGGLRPMAADTERFPSGLPEGLPALWFSFDPDENGRLPVAGSLADTARVSMLPQNQDSPLPERVAGRFGGALRFPDNQHSLQTSWPGIEGTMARSVSFWFRSEPDEVAGGIFMPVVAWGLPAGPRRMGLFSIQLGGVSGNLHLRVSSGRRWLEGGTALDDGNWHHVVVVLEGYNPGEWPVIKAYVDGNPEPLVQRLPEDRAAAPLETFHTVVDHPHSVPLTFGRFNLWKDYPSQPWEIDEVLIAAGILLPRQIEALRHNRLNVSGLAIYAPHDINNE